MPAAAPPLDERLLAHHAAVRNLLPPEARDEPLALFRALFAVPRLGDRVLRLGGAILTGAERVPETLRELMILRTSARAGAEYEWGVHALGFGERAGLTGARLDATVHGGAGDPCWSPAEAAVVRLADELHATGAVSDDLRGQLRAHLGEDQILELAITAGQYHVIAYALSAARVPLEPWAPRFPAADP